MPIPIVIGGYPRSGGTWLYNAVRLLWIELYGDENVYGGEIDAQGEARYDKTNPAHWHIVKTHAAYADLLLEAAKIFTSVRVDMDEAGESLDVFWRELTGNPGLPTRNQKRFWRHQLVKFEERHTHAYRMLFSRMTSEPEVVFKEIAAAAARPFTDEHIQSAWEALQNTRPPEPVDGNTVQDPVTLLWSHHLRRSYASSPQKQDEPKRKKSSRSKPRPELREDDDGDDRLDSEPSDEGSDTDQDRTDQ